ncbi:GtrA family protein [Dactylosporangium sp. AC04546]|uniref:GtrA family protein n=1 Tax=Dactylosporangium sp. AC04546 TaxID=2862460 RepID=UPI001EE15134|nr:GtrA family protein [Dactylosporangium sp. AC04546]WVK83588.1 GtrA family protein [Dactylosporangium sp. AC04546]
MTEATEARGRPRLTRTVVAFANDRRVRYLLVGGVSAVSYYGFYAGLYLLTRDWLHYLVPAFAANLLCAVVTYPLQRRFVFRSRSPLVAGFVKFYVVCLWALGFTLVGLPVLVELAGIPVLVSQAILIVTAPIINYQLTKFWVFRTRRGKPPRQTIID